MSTFIAAAFGDPNYWSDVGNGAVAAVFGVLLVMLVLMVMIAVLYGFKGIFVLIGKAEQKKKAKSEATDDQIQAAVTAAISEYRGDDQVKVQIKSIKKL